MKIFNTLNRQTKRLWTILKNGGVTNEEYRSITPLYSRSNRILWRSFSIIMCFAFVVLFVVSFFESGIALYRPLYFSMGVYAIFATVAFFTFITERSYVLLKIFIYLDCAVAFVFGIFIGAVFSTDESAIAFVAMLLLLPPLVLDRPIRVIALSLLATISFIVCVLLLKDESVWQTDIFNSVLYCILSCVLNTYLLKNRFLGYLDQYKLTQSVYHDALTGLSNELAYLREVARIDSAIHAGTCKPFAVVMMDVNNVKTTNDTYGHTFGCSLIVEAGRYIKGIFENSKAFHVGGDEFIVILEGNNYEKRESLIKQFDEGMEDYFITKEGIKLRLALARGLEIFDQEFDHTFRKVLTRADAKMYVNKRELKIRYDMPER